MAFIAKLVRAYEWRARGYELESHFRQQFLIFRNSIVCLRDSLSIETKSKTLRYKLLVWAYKPMQIAKVALHIFLVYYRLY